MRVEDYAWLPVALPAAATRLELHDRELAELIGAEARGGERADVEIGATSQLAGRAATAIVPVLEQPSTSGALVRAVVRVTRHVRARRLAAAAARDLARRGFGVVRTIAWEPGHRIDPAAATASRAERLPLGLVVVASRASSGPSIVDAAADASGCALVELRAMKSGAVVGAAAAVVLRVAVGTPATALARAQSVLADVRAAVPELASLVAEPRASGSAGLGRWTTETRLQGDAGRLDDGMLRQCVDVLARLHLAGAARGGPRPLAENARAVAARAPHAERELLQLAAQLEAELAALPRGFAHGDFWAGNLLSSDGRLTGVVDWDAGGAGRLPLLDLLHLLSAPSGPRTATPEPGAALEGVWRELDDADSISDYCQRIGLERQSPLLRRLAVAFWLERAAWVAERSGSDPQWTRRNVDGVLQFIAGNDVP